MAYGQDVLASTLVDLLPKYEELFTKAHPLLEKISKGGKVQKSTLKSHKREFTIVNNGPGDVQGIKFGSESLSSVRRNLGVRGGEHGFRAIYHFDVPDKDLAECGGEQDYARIIENYPNLAVADFQERFSRQVARGSASSGSDASGTGMDGFTTLNGQQSYSPQGTARTGIFQAAAPTAQTNTVHDIPMAAAASSPTPGWYHQYSHINAFSIDGLKTLRTAINRANMEGRTLEGGGVDLLLSDEGTFQNYLEAMDDKVIVINELNNPASKYIKRDGAKFGNADFYWDPAIDLTDTTSFSSATTTQLGVLYGLATAFWEFFTLAGNSQRASKGNWSAMPPVLLPDQDAWQYRIILHGNLMCRNLRHQVFVTGGAQT